MATQQKAMWQRLRSTINDVQALVTIGSALLALVGFGVVIKRADLIVSIADIIVLVVIVAITFPVSQPYHRHAIAAGSAAGGLLIGLMLYEDSVKFAAFIVGVLHIGILGNVIPMLAFAGVSSVVWLFFREKLTTIAALNSSNVGTPAYRFVSSISWMYVGIVFVFAVYILHFMFDTVRASLLLTAGGVSASALPGLLAALV
jgi:hypothetical protein